MGVTHSAKPIVNELRRIAAFLNEIAPSATQPQWDAFLNEVSQLTPEEQATMRRDIKEKVAAGEIPQAEADAIDWDAPPRVWRVTLDEAKKLRGEIDEDLSFLKAEQPLEEPFHDLVRRLNRLRLPMAWYCKPLASQAKPHDPSQAIIKIRWKNGMTGRWTTRSWHVTDGLQDYLYAVLGKALTSGLLSKLKTCQLCEQYLVVTRSTKRFCPRCKTTHGNHNRPAGYVQNWRAQNRADQIKKAHVLRRARKLTLCDKSVELLYEKTELPRRVVVTEIFKRKRPSARTPKPTGRAKSPASRQPVVETKQAIAARLRPIITDYYKRMAKLDRKKTTLVECPQCHRRRMVPIGARARCDHTDRAGSIHQPTKAH